MGVLECIGAGGNDERFLHHVNILLIEDAVAGLADGGSVGRFVHPAAERDIIQRAVGRFGDREIRGGTRVGAQIDGSDVGQLGA